MHAEYAPELKFSAGAASGAGLVLGGAYRAPVSLPRRRRAENYTGAACGAGRELLLGDLPADFAGWVCRGVDIHVRITRIEQFTK